LFLQDPACHSACGLALAHYLIVGDIASPSSRPNANSRPAAGRRGLPLEVHADQAGKGRDEPAKSQP